MTYLVRLPDGTWLNPTAVALVRPDFDYGADDNEPIVEIVLLSDHHGTLKVVGDVDEIAGAISTAMKAATNQGGQA